MKYLVYILEYDTYGKLFCGLVSLLCNDSSWNRWLDSGLSLYSLSHR